MIKKLARIAPGSFACLETFCKKSTAVQERKKKQYILEQMSQTNQKKKEKK